MKKFCAVAISILLVSPAFAASESRERKRVAACGQVFKEIMDIPDGIPKDLLNKAECVIVIPTVVKFAFGIGGDFGRGAITCRTGQHFTGHWSAPALFALEGANIGFQIGGEATDFVLLVMNPGQQSEVGCGRIRSSRSERSHRCSGYGHRDESGSSHLFPGARIVRRNLSGGFDTALGWQRK
jgi:SH3 domain-containing YSC84-like protein 1